MAKKIVISGWYGFGNIGDEAILQALILKFSNLNGENNQITVLSSRPEYTIQNQKVKAVYQFPGNLKGWIKSFISLRIFSTLRAIVGCDLFILGGGGFLSDWQKEAPLQWLGQARLAKFFGKRTMLYGIGAGPFSTLSGKRISKAYIDKYIDDVTVRDIYSYRALVDDVGIDKDKVVVTCDPALSLDVSNYSGISRKNTIGINFVELFKFRSFIGGEEKFQTYIEVLKKMVHFLQERFPDCNLEFVPMFESDSKFFNKYFSSEFPDIILKPVKTYKDFVDCLYGYKFFIGTRFHSLVFAIMTKTPLFALVYHPKSLAICETYHINYDVISDGSFPPLLKSDLDIEKFKSWIINLLVV